MQNALVAPRTSSHDRTFPPFGRALAAAGVLATLAVALPRHDASRLVPGYRCSIVSEREASAASGATLTLSPSDGHACRYVGNAAQGALALTIVARAAGAGVPLHTDAEPVRPASIAGQRAFWVGERLVIFNGRRSAMLTLEGATLEEAARRHTLLALAADAAPRLK